MLLRSTLVNRSTGELGAPTSHVLSLPDEILEQITLVLDQDEYLCLLDDISKVGNKFLAFA